MRQVFYSSTLTEEIVITGGDAHHLAHVMRTQIGDVITVVDAEGQAAEMVVTALTRDAVHFRMQRVLPAETAGREVILVQALLKGEKMDFIVQKAVELGAVCMCPIVTEHVVVRYDVKKAAAKAARWQKIADEAAKQCGRRSLMTVAPIVSLAELLQDPAYIGAADTVTVFCYEQEERQSMRTVLRGTEARRVTLIVGAEGGFSPAEAAAVTAAGGQSVSLGHRILRAETASLTALAVTQYELGNLDT